MIKGFTSQKEGSLASEDIYIESPSVIQKLISKSLHNDG